MQLLGVEGKIVGFRRLCRKSLIAGESSRGMWKRDRWVDEPPATSSQLYSALWVQFTESQTPRAVRQMERSGGTEGGEGEKTETKCYAPWWWHQSRQSGWVISEGPGGKWKTNRWGRSYTTHLNSYAKTNNFTLRHALKERTAVPPLHCTFIILFILGIYII